MTDIDTRLEDLIENAGFIESEGLLLLYVEAIAQALLRARQALAYYTDSRNNFSDEPARQALADTALEEALK